MNDFQIHHRENGDFDVEHLAPQRREERRQEAARHVSGIMGAENREWPPAAATGGASHSPVEIEDDGFITVWPERQQ